MGCGTSSFSDPDGHENAHYDTTGGLGLYNNTGDGGYYDDRGGHDDRPTDTQTDDHQPDPPPDRNDRTDENITHPHDEIDGHPHHDHHHHHHDDNRHRDDHRRGDERPDPDKDGDLKVQTFEFRVAPSDSYHDSEPRLRGGQWTDDEFPPHTAIHEFSANGLEWKRPTELTQSPVLFSEGTTRFDIGQGAAGTCWFLSMVANLSENPKLLAKVVQEGDYSPDRGVFHCRFWKFGEWEDVYIDDCLPVIYGRQIWGARSGTDDSEMWVSLLEKAFGKLHGSYNSIYGGQSSDAYLALTGGISERVDFEDQEIPLIPEHLFSRVRNALRTGAMVTCTVPDKYDKQYGLVGGHAYSLTGADVAQRFDGQKELLFRVRNPWGNTEWTGPWSDGSNDWSSIPEGSIQKVNIDDGEFWISMSDFLTFFSQTTICSLTPDFDMDGNTDSLNCVTRIYGQWLGETAAGFQERLQNPRFVFTVPKDVPSSDHPGMSEDGLVRMVVQLIQRTEHRKSDKISIRCDLYKVLGSQMSGRGKFVLELLGDVTNVFSPSVQCSFRFAVEPGQYVVVPSAIKPGLEKEFLIRIFSPCELDDCVEVKRHAMLMSCDSVSSVSVHGRDVKLSTLETFFGAWRAGYNAGGQISKRDTHHTNPQYAFTIPDTGYPVPVVFHLLPSQEGHQFPVGLRVYPLSANPPVDIDYLYSEYDNCPEPSKGKTFVITWDLDVEYVLPPGDYLVLLHMDEVDTEKEFAFHVKSSAHLNMRGYQTGE